MLNDPVYQRLLAARWRRPLTDAEAAELKAWLAAHPQFLPQWEQETALSQALARMPDVPVSSNFTARVMQAVDLERAATERAAKPGLSQRHRLVWLIRAGSAALITTTIWLAYYHSQTVERRQIAHSLALVANVSSLPSPRILQDFDAINAMNSAPAGDEQLLSLLQ